MLAAILRQQIRDIHAGISPSNRVEAARLKGQELEGVKDALRAVPELNELVRDMGAFHEVRKLSRQTSPRDAWAIVRRALEGLEEETKP